MINTGGGNLSNPAKDKENLVNKGSDFEMAVARANACIENGDWDGAYPHLKTALEINPNYADGLNHLGVYYAKKKNHTEAINNYKKALQCDFSLVDAHYNLASLYMERREFPMALSHFKEVVLAHPEDFETYYRMGLCCIDANMDAEAEIFLSESHRIKPDFIPATIELGKLLIKKEDYSMAKNVLLYALKTESPTPEVDFLLGIVYKAQKKFHKAMHHLRETVLKDENNAGAFNLLGECCMELNMDKQAESFFANAIKLDATNMGAFYNLGNLYYQQKKYDEAILYLEEYVKTKEAYDSINAIWSTTPQHEEDTVPLYNLLGHCYKMVNKFNQARTIWAKSLSIQPQQQDIKDALASLPQTLPPHKRISLVID